MRMLSTMSMLSLLSLLSLLRLLSLLSLLSMQSKLRALEHDAAMLVMNDEDAEPAGHDDDA